MTRLDTDLIMICASDVAGQLRGKAVPWRAWESRQKNGIGWTPTNVLQTSFGPIAPSPWGALGDLTIRPDPETLIDLEMEEAGIDESFALGDIFTLDDERWDCCLRGQLKTALERLEDRHGLRVKAAFEHEFHYSGLPKQEGLGYTLRTFRRLGTFPNAVMSVLDAAGLDIDTFMPEYGPGQCEVTVGPKPALRAADEAAILRDLVRACAQGQGERASFAPILHPDGVGNGVHVHFSLETLDGQPVCHDPTQPSEVARASGAFVAGILERLPEFLAIAAPSVPSYLRLQPHRWSAAFNNFGNKDRESAVRICPVFGTKDPEAMARKFHFEFRAADAAASPHLLLAALINAGLDGLDRDLTTPTPTETDLAKLSPEELKAAGCTRLASNLDDALSALTSSEWAAKAFGKTLIDVIDRHKRTEISLMEDLSDEEVCARYYEAY
ncbi:Glutamine synthetase (plasmid) [Sulfitobacter sp. DSM 110093]|uniref:glutamine synthetase family protein n=1 Tax=Sulfitobacter sp. DSM 110093 TaxID=2883127 RepID=UPI001FABE7E9|nr:glutamine synthetase family protein [Sulfitobacter sp. DSM 110093]UOA33794.1 Glutamine synthetase [Sulfitobacter sp. DSM 110093]UOA34055.1 Glutamine synthetase [Sulfitobacter sp. DSM 110093]